MDHHAAGVAVVSTNAVGRHSKPCAVAMLAAVLICVGPVAATAQLNSDEAKCVQTLNKGGAKLSKIEGKLQQKCIKDGAKGRLSGTVDECVDADVKNRVGKIEAKTLADEAKRCQQGSGFVPASGAQSNLSGKSQALELVRDLLGSVLEDGLEVEKARAKCQQKVQKAVDKVLAAKMKAYTKCAKGATNSAVDISGFESCLTLVAADSKVIKTIAKLADAREKGCGFLALDTIFPGSCAIANANDFVDCTEALAECRACTTIAGMNGLTTDCDLFDNGADDGSCADTAPSCGDGNVDPGEECDPGAEPTCCSDTCTNEANGLPCDDGAFCNGVDTCLDGACAHPGDPCSGGSDCNGTCNESTDDCFDPASAGCTDDGNECTDDVCDGAGGCTHPGNFDPCTDDGNECTDDVCDGTGSCSHPNNTSPCTDDGNVCTDDVCDGAGSCGHPSNTISCDDGNACTTVDVCGGGTCNGSVPPDCSDGNVCTDDVCIPATGCDNPNNTASCDDLVFCNGTDTCFGGSCSVHVGDPCAGGGQCNQVCNELGGGSGNCFDSIGTTCDSGVVGPNDNCDVTNDTCDGAGVCVNSDPAQIPEQCYTAGDEDCDGAADTADTDADSQCQANGIVTCTCASACEVRRIIPAASGTTSLDGLAPWSSTSSGSVTTTISNATLYGTSTRTGLSYALSSIPANLDLWWGFTGNAGHNPDLGGGDVTQFRFAASESDAQDGADQINEGPHTSQTTGATDVEFIRTDGLPIQVNIGCSSNTSTSLEIRRTGGPTGSWTTYGSGSSFPTAALAPASLQTDVTTNLLSTRLLPVTGSGTLTTDVNLQLGGAAIDPLYDACHTPGGLWGYGVNFTAAFYGSYRNANVCP